MFSAGRTEKTKLSVTHSHDSTQMKSQTDQRDALYDDIHPFENV